jgi:hypothetical protein
MDLTQIILWCLAMGFSAALVAQYKGFRARTWFALGVLLGPIALLIVSIQTKKVAQSAHAAHPLSD